MNIKKTIIKGWGCFSLIMVVFFTIMLICGHRLSSLSTFLFIVFIYSSFYFIKKMYKWYIDDDDDDDDDDPTSVLNNYLNGEDTDSIFNNYTNNSINNNNSENTNMDDIIIGGIKYGRIFDDNGNIISVDDNSEISKPNEEEIIPPSNTEVNKTKPYMNPFEELSNLIGLSNVKLEINNLSNLVKVQKMRESRGMKTSNVSYHCVFTGNPGTGKTTVARIVAGIYKELGVIKKGHLVETDRSGLVAEYVGQTAPKTNAIIDSALDGVLFIDEAYSLVQGGQNDFGKEAVATLLKRMEDDRERLVVILAGYSKEMEDFISSNSGLQSRFNRYIDFPDYNADELMRIFEYTVKKNDFSASKEALSKVKEIIHEEVAHKDEKFGNARFIRNLFENIITEQANRLTLESNITNDKLSKIEEIDVISVLGYYFKKELHKNKEPENKEKTVENDNNTKSLWEYFLNSWTENGWRYENTCDGFILRYKDDDNIAVDVGFYMEHYYIQAQYKDDIEFAKVLKKEKGGHRSYSQWWTHLDDPYFNIKQGGFMSMLHTDMGLEKYIVYYVNELMGKLIERHNVK